MQKSVMKYITRIGQNTGMLKNSKKVQAKAMDVALVAEYQNLNSGNLLMKGLNSSFWEVGNAGPSSSACDWLGVSHVTKILASDWSTAYLILCHG